MKEDAEETDSGHPTPREPEHVMSTPNTNSAGMSRFRSELSPVLSRRSISSPDSSSTPRRRRSANGNTLVIVGEVLALAKEKHHALQELEDVREQSIHVQDLNETLKKENDALKCEMEKLQAGGAIRERNISISAEVDVEREGWQEQRIRLEQQLSELRREHDACGENKKETEEEIKQFELLIADLRDVHGKEKATWEDQKRSLEQQLADLLNVHENCGKQMVELEEQRKDIEQQLADLQRLHNAWQEERRNYQHQLTDLRQVHEKCVKEKAEWDEERQRIRLENVQCNAQSIKYEQELFVKTEELEKATKELKAKMEASEEMNKNITACQEKILTLTQHNNQLTELFERKENEFALYKQANNQDEYKEKLKTADDKAEEKEREAEEHKKTLQELQAMHKEVLDENVQKTAEILSLQSQNSAMQSEVREMKQRLKERGDEMNRMRDMDHELMEVRDQLDDARRQLEERTHEKERIEAEQHSNREELHRMRKELTKNAAMVERLQSLEDELAEAIRQNENILQQLGKEREMNEQLVGENGDTHKQLAQFKLEFDAFKEEADCMFHEEIEKMASENAVLRARVGELEGYPGQVEGMAGISIYDSLPTTFTQLLESLMDDEVISASVDWMRRQHLPSAPVEMASRATSPVPCPEMVDQSTSPLPSPSVSSPHEPSHTLASPPSTSTSSSPLVAFTDALYKLLKHIPSFEKILDDIRRVDRMSEEEVTEVAREFSDEIQLTVRQLNDAIKVAKHSDILVDKLEADLREAAEAREVAERERDEYAVAAVGFHQEYERFFKAKEDVEEDLVNEREKVKNGEKKLRMQEEELAKMEKVAEDAHKELDANREMIAELTRRINELSLSLEKGESANRANKKTIMKWDNVFEKLNNVLDKVRERNYKRHAMLENVASGLERLCSRRVDAAPELEKLGRWIRDECRYLKEEDRKSEQEEKAIHSQRRQ